MLWFHFIAETIFISLVHLFAIGGSVVIVLRGVRLTEREGIRPGTGGCRRRGKDELETLRSRFSHFTANDKLRFAVNGFTLLVCPYLGLEIRGW